MPQRLEDLEREIAIKSGMRELLRRWAVELDEDITKMEETKDRIEIQRGTKGKA
jgi:hypothetical protein